MYYLFAMEQSLEHKTATLREIYNQPRVWDTCLQFFDTLDIEALAGDRNPSESEWIFIGCGTSYYLAQAAASSFTTLVGRKASAVPASEFMLFPHLVIAHEVSRIFPILISRSGHTSEILQVAARLKESGIDFLAITCDGNELASTTSRVVKLPVAESSTVMTSSFTSMLLALQYIAAWFAGDSEFLLSLKRLPDHLTTLLQKYGPEVERFATSRQFEDFVSLGQGPLYSIASETALKVMESSSSYAQYFHTLEFRHGPKSIVSEDTLVSALISETGYADEILVLQEMKELGSLTMAVTNRATVQLHSIADLVIELSLPVPELARIVVYVVWGQLLGSYTGLAKGLDPDHPRHLSRVVTLPV